MSYVLFIKEHPSRLSRPWMEAWAAKMEHASILKPEPFVYADRELWSSAINEELNNLPEPRWAIAEGLGATALAHALSHEDAAHVEGGLLIQPLLDADVPEIKLRGFQDFPVLPAIRDIVFVCGQNFSEELIQRTLSWSRAWGGIFAVMTSDEEWTAALHLIQSLGLTAR